ncbi:MAG TPA: translation elongation factor Ts [Candidatus Bipolaricaulota bacterium]|nr:translation elongation factor Ts [Candidatus Bipolaricaulota bacterium]
MDLQQVAKLRQRTGCGINDCKLALEEANGDENLAIDILRKKGEIKAAKKSAERETKEGLVFAYIHPNKRIGAMIELDCETDFVARNEEFQELAKDLAMQVAATNPLYLSSVEVPEEVLNKEKEIYRDQLLNESKPDNIVEKIVEGKLAKYYEEVCLLNQPFIKDEDVTIEQLITEKIAKIGEKIAIAHFVRFEV